MSYAAAYDEAGSSRKKKNAVAMLIFNHVTDYSSPPGRFLVPFDGEIARIDREESCGRLRRDHAMWKEVRFWRVMTEREALAKTMQSLRDALRTERIIQEIPDSETDPSPIPAPVSDMGPHAVDELEDRDFTCIDPLSPLTDPISDVQPIVEAVDHDLPCISIDDMDFEVDMDMDINMLDIEREIEHSQKDPLQDDACTGRHLPLSSMPLPQPLPLSPQLPTLPALRDSQRLCVRSPQILASSEADDSQIFSTAAYEGFKEADLQTVLQWIRDDAKNDYDGGGSPMPQLLPRMTRATPEPAMPQLLPRMTRATPAQPPVPAITPIPQLLPRTTRAPLAQPPEPAMPEPQPLAPIPQPPSPSL